MSAPLTLSRSVLCLLLALVACLPRPAHAFPPAPHHAIYGTVRDPYGRPLGPGEGAVILNGTTSEIVRGPTDPAIGVGINYELDVPMDSGTSAALYQVTALRPLLPFTIKVVIGGVNYVPIEITGKTWSIGQPGGRTRLDLTLGIDSNNDGLPDVWQQAVVDADRTGRLKTIDDVKPNDDLSGNGLTNLQKFLAGVDALDRLDGVRLDVVGVAGGTVQLRFLAVAGRTYTIRSSPDTVAWSAQPFCPGSATAAAVSSFRPDTVQLMDVYVPWPGAQRGYFQLFAQ